MARHPLVGGLLLAFALAACSPGATTAPNNVSDTPAPTAKPQPSPTAGGYTLQGIATLVSADQTGSWDSCQGTGGYDDFEAGTNVSVRDATGKLIGAGVLRHVSESLLPTIVEMDQQPGPLIGLTSTEKAAAIEELRSFLRDAVGNVCLLYWQTPVPRSDFYSVEVGRRGSLDYSFDQMSENGFVVGSQLGN